MKTTTTTEDRLRELAPLALGVVVRRYGNFADAEDAVQEALVAASVTWPTDGEPDRPLAWLIRVASRRMADQYRRDDARRRREDLAASWSLARPEPVVGQDDTLILMFMCCHPSLTPASAIPLTLRAVGGLSTREIATAFLVPETTMAQRISRAKAKIKESGEPFRLPSPDQRGPRLRSVLHTLYLLFNEGYASSGGPDLGRTDLSTEAIRLARLVCGSLPEDPEAAGLLALMLLNDARRGARTRADGELVPLAAQDRRLWDRALIAEGVALVTDLLQRGQLGEYQVQAAIAAIHDQSPSHDDTKWPQIVALYRVLERMTDNPMVTLNLAVAVAMVDGPIAGLALVDGIGDRLGDHHRLHSVRAHLLESAGDAEAAIVEFKAAAARTGNVRERHYLTTKAARLSGADTASPSHTLVDLHRRACDGFSRAVEAVSGQWDAATPCEDWDARAVLDHVIGFHDVLVLRPLDAKPTRSKDDPVARWAVTVDVLFAALAQPDAVDPSLLGALTTDVLVHTWDLARATGQPVTLDPELCEIAWQQAAANEARFTVSEMFGPPVGVPSDAPLQDRLLGLFGRDPDWSPKPEP